jgi:endonuclease/exonuclease/phosphatase family metal-dependent hydrolase
MPVIDFILRLLTWLVAIALAGSYIAPHVNPNAVPLLSLFGLAYPYLLASLLLLLLYWLLRWKKTIILPAIALLAGYPSMTRYYAMNSNADQRAPAHLEILSYNVHHLENRRAGSKRDMAEYIRQFPGDVACLQDFPRGPDPSRLFPGYPHLHARKDLVILSRRPVIHRGAVELDKNDAAACIYCDVLLANGDTARVYCMHLESFRFNGNDRRLVTGFPDMQREDISRGLRSIVSRLLVANKRRAIQARVVKQHAARSPHKTVLCGDFNDTPLSYTYALLKKGTLDSFIEKGRGVGNTYIGDFPSFRIDYILHHPSLQTLSYSRDTIQLSDHYPIRARLSSPD